MKFMKKYRKKGMAAAIAAVSLITSLLVPQFSAVAATSERVTLLIAPKTIIGDSKGDYVGWTEFSSDTVGEIEAGDISGAWYMQKIGNTGEEWRDYAVYNNQNSNDISGFLWEAAYLKDPGISLKMGVDNTFRHRATSESLKADNGKTKHDCAFVRKTIDQTLVTHENCEACVTEQGKYDWSMMPAKMINEETGKKEEDFFFYFEDNDTAGLFLNGVVDEVVDRTSKIKEQYYTGFVLYLNESPESASYKNERQMKSGIYYCINTNFSTTSYRNGGYKKASDVKSGKSGVYQLKTFRDALEEQGLVTFGVSKGEEGRDSNKADDNYTDVSFESKLKNGKVTVTATVKNKKTGVDTSLSFTGDADYYRSEGSIGFFSYSQPCATFAEIQVTGTPPEFTITYDADGGKFADGTTKDIVQPVKLYDFEYVDTTEYYYPIPVGTLEGKTVSRTGYHIKDDHNTPSKSGGWYYEVFDEKKEKELLSTMYYTDHFHESITVKPAWEVNAGTVKYNGNGGTLIDSTNKPKNTTIKYTTEKVNLRNAEDFWERTGYYIPAATAWHVGSKTSETIITESKDSTEAATTLKEELELDKKHDTSVTLYANWNPYKLTVKYNANGGTGTFSNETMYYDDASKPKTYSLTSTVPTRDGYTFLGWSTKQTAAASDTIFTGSTAKKTAQAWASALGTSINTSNKTVTLYAQWKAQEYTLTFNGNGGKTSDNKTAYNQNPSPQYDVLPFTLNANKFIRTGYKMDGWKITANATSVTYADKASITKNLAEPAKTYHLYASWSPYKLTVKYDVNGGMGTFSDTVMYYDDSSKPKTYTLSSTEPTRTGYTFKGWATSKTYPNSKTKFSKDSAAATAKAWATAFETSINTSDAEVTLYAQWESIEYKIRFDGNGNTSGTMEDMTMKYDVAKELTPNAYTRAGYTFNSWNTKADGTGDRYEDKQSVINLTSVDNSIVVLYAQWDAVPYTIRFNANGGEGHMDDISPVYYDEEITLPECSFTKENEYGPSGFKGWNTKGDTKDYLYEDKATVKNLTEEMNKVVVLYAIWDDCPGIEARDLYYTLEQAQSGYITEDELLNQAKAFDLEDNEIPPGTHETNSFRVMDYQESDFTQLTMPGSVTETYKVIDSFGNTYKERIKVTIIDTSPDVLKTLSDNIGNLGTTRFISEKYFNLPYEQGGLETNSIWLLDPSYRQVLQEAFINLKNDTPEATYAFTHEEILQMQEFIKTNGFGNSKSPDALERFYNQFLRN